MNPRTVELISRRLRALGEPTRLRIVEALARGDHSVGELVETLRIHQSNASKHLQVLFQAGLVRRRRAGNAIIYSLAEPGVFRVCLHLGRRLGRSGAS